jgi:hypothetical protein
MPNRPRCPRAESPAPGVVSSIPSPSPAPEPSPSPLSAEGPSPSPTPPDDSPVPSPSPAMVPQTSLPSDEVPSPSTVAPGDDSRTPSESPSPSPSAPPASPSPEPQGTRWVKQVDLATWAGKPIPGKAGKVPLKKASVEDAPGRCQALAEKANAAAFSVAATASGVPKYCYLYASRPAKQCGPSDKKLACAFKGLGAFAREP